VSLLLKIGTFLFSLCSCLSAWTLRFAIPCLNKTTKTFCNCLHIDMKMIVIFIHHVYLVLFIVLSKMKDMGSTSLNTVFRFMKLIFHKIFSVNDISY
jgi:hypothetical protein